MTAPNLRVLVLGLAFAMASSSALAQQWKPGQVVLGSPIQGDFQWLRCQVLGGPNEADYYELKCVDSNLDTNGNKRRYETGTVRAPGKWIKADDPSFKPDMQFAAVRAAPARPNPPRAPAAAGGARSGTLPDGRYTCQIWIGSMLSTLGFVDIKGRSYRGPSHTPGGPFKPLATDASGRVLWNPNFSSLAAAGATITGTRITGSAAKPSFNVDYTTRSGFKESLTCSRV